MELQWFKVFNPKVDYTNIFITDFFTIRLALLVISYY